MSELEIKVDFVVVNPTPRYLLDLFNPTLRYLTDLR